MDPGSGEVLDLSAKPPENPVTGFSLLAETIQQYIQQLDSEDEKPQDLTVDKSMSTIIGGQIDQNEESVLSCSEFSPMGGSDLEAFSSRLDEFLTGKGPNKFKTLMRIQARETCTFCGSFGKDHFHCEQATCKHLKLLRVDEAERHVNYHRKKEICLQKGFLRFSSHESCALVQNGCSYAGKNTHYHCMQRNCWKVILTTTELEMHRKHHLRDKLIESEGFMRYSASESCGISTCEFINERTTHFHCARDDCDFSFKDKSGIEKHKSFHAKNDEYAGMGFVKHAKGVNCGYANCGFSITLNHFHCLTDGCDFSSPMTAKMVSHRKHHQKLMSMCNSMPSLRGFKTVQPKSDSGLLSLNGESPLSQISAHSFNELHLKRTQTSPNLSLKTGDDHKPRGQSGSSSKSERKCIFPFCTQTTEHWHCSERDCKLSFGTKHQLTEHERKHKMFKAKVESCFTPWKNDLGSSKDGGSYSICQITTENWKLCGETVRDAEHQAIHYAKHLKNILRLPTYWCNCDWASQEHFHCTADDCNAVLSTVMEADQHCESLHGENLAPNIEANNVEPMEIEHPSTTVVASEHKTIFPTKNQDQIHPLSIDLDDKNDPYDLISPSSSLDSETSSSKRARDQLQVDESMYVCVKLAYSCPFKDCDIVRRRHYHCNLPNCSFITSNVKTFSGHYKKHVSSERRCQPGYKHFCQKVDCMSQFCCYRKKSAHFHCVRAGCHFSFTFANQMESHTRRHERQAKI